MYVNNANSFHIIEEPAGIFVGGGGWVQPQKDRHIDEKPAKKTTKRRKIEKKFPIFQGGGGELTLAPPPAGAHVQ